MSPHPNSAFLAIDYPRHPVFTTRLGLTVAELCDGHDGQYAVIGKIIRIAIQADAAYVAREVLGRPDATLITHETRAMLCVAVRQAGLGHI